MLKITYTSKFKKDVKLAAKRGKDISRLTKVIDMLASEQPLPVQFKDHSLSGDYIGFRDCHIEPDWILVYRVNKDILELLLARTGTHSDLFK